MELNNICMYTKEYHDTKIMSSGEHIFLASIGGIKKLPKEYVSHNVNNEFSLLEKRFSRESLVSMNRQFEGPGKRGKLNEKKASKSNVCVMFSDEITRLKDKYSLGYIKLGKPYVINHLIFDLNENSLSVSLDPNLIKSNISNEQSTIDFFSSIKKFEKYVILLEEKLPENIALFGESEGRYFLAIRDSNIETKAVKEIEKVITLEKMEIISSNEFNNKVEVYQHYKINLEEYNRIIAKMAFNFLASEEGLEFVLDARFDNLRKWILNGEGNEELVNMVARDYNMEKKIIPMHPDRAHYIIILQIKKLLVALVSLYGESTSYFVKLAELEAYESIIRNPIGLICDWKNRKEFTLSEHIASICID